MLRIHFRHLAAFATVMMLEIGLEAAQAFPLSVYGSLGFDMVSTQSDASQGGNITPPEPSGPSYSLGVSTEFRPFGSVGVSVGLGLSGFHSTWEAEQEDALPGGTVLSSIGAGLGLDAHVYFGSFIVGGGGSFHYGFADTYNMIFNAPPQTIENDVPSLMRLEGHLSVGYSLADFIIMGRLGAGTYMVDLVPPPTSGIPNPEAAQDVYSGFMFSLAVSYAIIGPETSPRVSKPKKIRKRGKEFERRKKRKKRRPSRRRRTR